MQISVVIPLYNKARFVEETVRSALNQVHPVHEVIVVNDGSTDDGGRRVAAIGDPRVRLVWQANAGVSRARNHGVELATGDWIAFLDADDWWHPEFLQRIAAARVQFPGAKMVAGGFSEVSGNQQSIAAWSLAERPRRIEWIEDLRTRWLQGRSFMTSGIVIQTALLKGMQPCFAPGESIGEDLDLWFRVSDRTSIAFDPTPLIAYRAAVDGSLTSRATIGRMPPYLLRMRQDALSGKIPQRHREAAIRFVAQIEITVARDMLAQGRRLAALQWLIRAYPEIGSARWQLTALMVLLPGAIAGLWQRWRVGQERRVIPQ